MKKETKIIIWIAVITVVIIGGYFGVKNFIDNLNYNFGIPGGVGTILGQLQNAKIKKTQSGQNISSIPIPIQVSIDNNNNIPIKLKNVSASIAYNGGLIINTNPNSQVLNKITIPANTKGYTITDNVNILVNQNSLDLISSMLAGNKPIVSISLGADTLLGLPLNGTFSYPLPSL